MEVERRQGGCRLDPDGDPGRRGQPFEVGADGMVHAPTKPGLGAEIDFELIRRKTVQVLS